MAEGKIVAQVEEYKKEIEKKWSFVSLATQHTRASQQSSP
jgi:hypothetical protein